MAFICKTGKATINGGHLAYQLYQPKDEQKNIPVIMVAGWASTMHSWFELPAEIARRGRTCLVFDNRGIALSKDHGGPITIPEMTSDVVLLAQEVLGPGPFIGVGHSMGAFIVQNLALTMPEKVAAAVMIGGQGAKKTAEIGRNAKAFFKIGKASWHNQTDLEARKEIYSYVFSRTLRDGQDGDFDSICQRSLQDARPQLAHEGQMKALSTGDFGSKLGEIRCPVLVIHGEHDQVIPASCAKQLHADLTGSRMKSLWITSEAGDGEHFVYAPDSESSRKIMDKVDAFLSRALPPASRL